MPARALLLSLLVLAGLPCAATAQQAGPQTGFEQRDGASFTTFDEEQSFLRAVDQQSPRAGLRDIGRTTGGRPVQLVEIADPGPGGPQQARQRPTFLMICSQHGNEPAGREACLKLLRDLAFTTDPKRVDLMRRSTFLFVPAANPDGRIANTRENAGGVDVNRDHVTLETPEARAMAQVILDYAPEVSVDLHEYGPSQPVVYDDSVLWLWPRNLNVDKEVHDAAIDLGRKYLVPAVEAKGYTMDEYGQQEVADNDVAQTAGDGDEGIMRNAMGLRHVLGILAETRVDGDVRQSPAEVVDTAALQRRRVDSHLALLDGLLKFADERGTDVARMTAAAMDRKAAEGAARSAPLFFGGADNEAPTAEQTVSPPPCSYDLTAADVSKLGPRLSLLGISGRAREGGGLSVGLDQPSEPVIPLILDARGSRHVVAGKASEACLPPAARPSTAGTPKAPSARSCVKRRQVVLAVPRAGGRVLSARVTANGRRQRVRGRSVAVDLRRFRGTRTVRVRFTLRVRRDGRVRTRVITRTLRICR